jgi:nucleoside-diphosphate-sugar epimerase
MTIQPTTNRALVTGASGFIGSHLVQQLLDAGWKVAVLGRKDSVRKINLPAESRAYVYNGGIADVLAALAEFKPAVVFHLASLFLATHTPEQIEPLIGSNILFGTQLLEAMSKFGCTALVNAGTCWQNYVQEPPFDAPDFVPVNLYAATKQAFEDIAAYYVQTAGLRSITLRLFDSYGLGDTRRKLLRLLLETLKTGQPLGMSPGGQIIDMVHVEDICRAFLHAAARAMAFSTPIAEVYAISGNERRTLRQVVATFEEAAACKLPIEFGKRAYRQREVMHLWEGPALPGWQPKISLLEGFRDLIAHELLAKYPTN